MDCGEADALAVELQIQELSRSLELLVAEKAALGLSDEDVDGEEECLRLELESLRQWQSRQGGKAERLQAAQHPAQRLPHPTAPCIICFDSFDRFTMLCAGPPDTDQPGTSAAPAHGCRHYACGDCMRQYVCAAVEGRRYPLTCPSPRCRNLLRHDDVLTLLEERADSLQVLRELEVEHAIGLSQRLYCPYKDCSAMLVKAEGRGEEAGEAAGPSLCPVCKRSFCPSCVACGWHQGYTCGEFQALPAHLRSADDAAMLRLAGSRHWKGCPSCSWVIERTQGCNHMRCRCGTSFCYKCGQRYENTAPTAYNNHGKPGCKCPLFDVPPEPGQRPAGLAAPQPAPAVWAQQQRPGPAHRQAAPAAQVAQQRPAPVAAAAQRQPAAAAQQRHAPPAAAGAQQQHRPAPAAGTGAQQRPGSVAAGAGRQGPISGTLLHVPLGLGSLCVLGVAGLLFVLRQGRGG